MKLEHLPATPAARAWPLPHSARHAGTPRAPLRGLRYAVPLLTPAFSIDSDFARDVLNGLSHPRKRIHGDWLHDRSGGALFEAITRLPQYHPAHTEQLLLQHCAGEIALLAGPGASLVELGRAGNCKSPLPAGLLQSCFAGMALHPAVLDAQQIEALPAPAQGRRVLISPGSAIGKFDPDEALVWLRKLSRLARPGDLLVLGADASTDPSRLLAAYDDTQGVTAAFNKNLLLRMNRELDANFDVHAFRHAARLDTRQHRVELHLVSCKPQSVRVAGRVFDFGHCESIHTDSAYQHGLARIHSLGARAGWVQRQLWTDARADHGVHVFERER